MGGKIDMKPNMRKETILKKRLVKPTIILMAIFVAFLFIGSAIVASLAEINTTLENNIEKEIDDLGDVESIVHPSAPETILDTGYWYAFGAYSTVFFGPGRFEALDASTFENIAPLTADSHPFAGDWYDGGWIVLSHEDNKLYDVCVETGDQTYRATTTVPGNPSGLTVHQGTLYVSNAETLYEIDPDTGETTYIGDHLTGGLMISIASDDDQIYGISISDDSSYTIDPVTGEATLIGPTGYSMNFAQDMAVDRNTGEIYHAAYMGGGTCHLTKLNKATGELDYVSTFPSVEIIAFAIPYISGIPPDTPDAPSGPDTGFTNTEYSFTASTTHPEGNDIWYRFDWDDGTNSGWLGPYAPGATVTAYNTWTEVGVYDITVKARDGEFIESDVSPAHTITIIEGPMLEIENIEGGLFRISATIKNTGSLAANNIQWNISLDGGLILTGRQKNGQILVLDPGTERTITSDPIIGFGKTMVTVTASVPLSSATEQQEAIVLLFFIRI